MSTKKNLLTISLKSLLFPNSISEETWGSLKPVGTRTGRMYGPCKVQKDIIDNCPPFQPILPPVNTPVCKLAKFLEPILRSLTGN